MHQLIQQLGRHDPDGHDPVCGHGIGHEGQKLPEFIVGHVGHVPPNEIPPGIGHCWHNPVGHDPVGHDWHAPGDDTGKAVLQGPHVAPVEPPSVDEL
jgi:hypothetical protein